MASQLVGVDGFDPITMSAVLLIFAALGTATTARLAVRASHTSLQRILWEE